MCTLDGRLTGVVFEKVAAQYDAKGRRSLVPTGEPDVTIECDDVLVAVGQENAFPWIERDSGVEFGRDGLPVLDKSTFQSTEPKVFFGGDSALGPKNIITAVAHGHEAAISIDLYCRGESRRSRPPPMTNLVSQKMGIHEWSYDNEITLDRALRRSAGGNAQGAEEPDDGGRTRLRHRAGDGRGGALPQLRRADGVFGAGLHRMRRLRRHLPDGLHHLHRQRRRTEAARFAQRAG